MISAVLGPMIGIPLKHIAFERLYFAYVGSFHWLLVVHWRGCFRLAPKIKFASRIPTVHIFIPLSLDNCLGPYDNDSPLVTIAYKLYLNVEFQSYIYL